MGEYHPSAADILYGSFIRYDRLYEMTKFAFYGEIKCNSVNIYIDVYSIIRSLYTRGSNLQIDDSCSIASCIINLAIHLRSYFETRHKVASKVYIVYGGAKPSESFANYYKYNEKNIIMEDSNPYLKNMILDNMELVKILVPYLYDIFYIEDLANEFSIIVSTLIDNVDDPNPNVIYSKEPLSYQLVAFKNRTCMYRPRKKLSMDASWVVTKSTLYDAYRYGELNIETRLDTTLDIRMFSIYQAIAGVRTRSMNSIKNGNATIKLLENAVASNIFSNGISAPAVFYAQVNPFEIMFKDTKISPALVTNRLAAIDLNFQTMLYKTTAIAKSLTGGIINLYNPHEVRAINDKYFQKYPLDLNRV